MFSDSLLKSLNFLKSHIVFPFAKVHICSCVGTLFRHHKVDRCPWRCEWS